MSIVPVYIRAVDGNYYHQPVVVETIPNPKDQWGSWYIHMNDISPEIIIASDAIKTGRYAYNYAKERLIEVGLGSCVPTRPLAPTEQLFLTGSGPTLTLILKYAYVLPFRLKGLFPTPQCYTSKCDGMAIGPALYLDYSSMEQVAQFFNPWGEDANYSIKELISLRAKDPDTDAS